MDLLKDLVQITEAQKAVDLARQEFLLLEQKQALYFLEVKAAAELLTNAGIETSVRNIAEFANLFDKEVDAAVSWFEKKAPGKLPFQMNHQSAPRSDLDVLMAGLAWLANRRLTRTKGRTTPPLDRSVLGVQKVMQLTGLGRVRILELAEQEQAAILKQFPDFKMAWINDDASVVQKNAKNQLPETKIKLIRQAIEEIAQGRIGTVTAEQLSKWKKGAIGLDVRAIDHYLQTRLELKDLDKYRAVGSHYRETDKDREAAYMRRRSS